MMIPIEIRPITDAAGCTAVETLQKKAWNLAGNLEVVPAHMLLTFAKNGGVLLGAYAEDRLVGFVAGFIGLGANGRFKHASHMMGIHPDFQRQQIGYRLKLAQRQAVQQQGLDLITWTFDPLEPGNARLNMHKLGAICHTYIPNLYGDIEGINAGLPSDRLLVEWQINSTHVAKRLASDYQSQTAVSESLILNSADKSGRPPTQIKAANESQHFVQIPKDIREMKVTNPALALAWRLHTRQLFTELLAQNYAITDFLFQAGSGYYQLEKL